MGTAQAPGINKSHHIVEIPDWALLKFLTFIFVCPNPPATCQLQFSFCYASSGSHSGLSAESLALVKT